MNKAIVSILALSAISMAAAESFSVQRLSQLIPGVAIPYAMNSKGQIAGTLSGGTGFIYSPGRPLVLLPGLQPQKINIHGDVVGSTGNNQGFFRSRSGTIVMLPRPGRAVNDLGQFIYHQGAAAELTCILRDETGIIRTIGGFGGYDLTNSGRVAGCSMSWVGEFLYSRPRIWEPDGTLTVINEPFSTQDSTLRLINESGLVFGSEYSLYPRAYWNSGGVSLLAGIEGAVSLNEDGIGLGYIFQSGTSYAFLIQPGRPSRFLDPMLDGEFYWSITQPICRSDDGSILVSAVDPWAVPERLLLTPRSVPMRKQH